MFIHFLNITKPDYLYLIVPYYNYLTSTVELSPILQDIEV